MLKSKSPVESLGAFYVDDKISASTKSHASEKIKNPYFDILKIASDVFFDADSKSPHIT